MLLSRQFRGQKPKFNLYPAVERGAVSMQCGSEGAMPGFLVEAAGFASVVEIEETLKIQVLG